MTKEFNAYSIHYSCNGFYDGGYLETIQMVIG